MKKVLGILAILVGALIAFGVVSKRAEANKAVFNTGSQDEREFAKQKSLDFLRGRAAQRAIGNPDEYDVKRVEIDELRTAHTHVQQRVGGIKVWEAEAIVHLDQAGEVVDLTDNLADGVAVNTTPDLDEKRAIRLALADYEGRAKQTDPTMVEMYIYRGEDRDRLTYRVETPRLDGSPATCDPVVMWTR